MIEFNHVSVTYPGAAEPVLNDVTMSIPEGEFVLVVGKTGSGKSTLLSTLNGLVPHPRHELGLLLLDRPR